MLRPTSALGNLSGGAGLGTLMPYPTELVIGQLGIEEVKDSDLAFDVCCVFGISLPWVMLATADSYLNASVVSIGGALSSYFGGLAADRYVLIQWL